MSRRDGTIVAWHEVPGTTPPQKSRPVGYGVIRPGVRTDWSDEISNTKTEKFMLYDLFQQTVYDIEPQLEYHRTPIFQEEYLALRNTAHISTRNTSGFAAPDHTVPYGTVLSGWRCPRHFVPGYDRAVPPGQKPIEPPYFVRPASPSVEQVRNALSGCRYPVSWMVP